ncbi:hypothetical protein ACS0TY_024370 [Phlomoides rotata]
MSGYNRCEDEDVQVISVEAPILFTKMCELFILELTIRSWLHVEENKRQTLQKNDIAVVITRMNIFDFLVDIVPRDEIKDEVAALGRIVAHLDLMIRLRSLRNTRENSSREERRK